MAGSFRGDRSFLVEFERLQSNVGRVGRHRGPIKSFPLAALLFLRQQLFDKDRLRHLAAHAVQHPECAAGQCQGLAGGRRLLSDLHTTKVNMIEMIVYPITRSSLFLRGREDFVALEFQPGGSTCANCRGNLQGGRMARRLVAPGVLGGAKTRFMARSFQLRHGDARIPSGFAR